MKVIVNDIVERKVFPVIIKNDGKSYLTLYYYNLHDDCLLHNDSHLICFDNNEDLETFCLRNDLSIEQDGYTFDFDLPIVAPTDYKAVMNNWNLLNTISNIFGMYFEGNDRKYNSVYNLLFRYVTALEKLPEKVYFKEQINKRLVKVFKKKNRLLNKFILFEPK